MTDPDPAAGDLDRLEEEWRHLAAEHDEMDWPEAARHRRRILEIRNVIWHHDPDREYRIHRSMLDPEALRRARP